MEKNHQKIGLLTANAIVYARNYESLAIQIHYFDIENILKLSKFIVQYRLFNHLAAQNGNCSFDNKFFMRIFM